MSKPHFDPDEQMIHRRAGAAGLGQAVGEWRKFAVVALLAAAIVLVLLIAL